jgi:Uma2 family endonuclease
MTAVGVPFARRRIVYPNTDGQPIAENTVQFEWIVTIKGGLDHLFAEDPNVFVAGDLFWYPVEGHPEIVVAPDAMVAFDRPKGHRLSYLQWEEGNIPSQVVFEVLSPGNRVGEMVRKHEFYALHGVEEYYIYNPDPQRLELSGYLRQGDKLVEIPSMNGHVSPRLKIRFDFDDAGLKLIRPDGQRFLTFEETAEREQLARQHAESETRRAEQEQERAEKERQRADQALIEVEQLRQRLRSLGQEPGNG